MATPLTGSCIVHLLRPWAGSSATCHSTQPRASRLRKQGCWIKLHILLSAHTDILCEMQGAGKKQVAAVMGVQTARSSTKGRPFMRLKPQNIAVQVPLDPADAEVNFRYVHTKHYASSKSLTSVGAVCLRWTVLMNFGRRRPHLAPNLYLPSSFTKATVPGTTKPSMHLLAHKHLH